MLRLWSRRVMSSTIRFILFYATDLFRCVLGVSLEDLHHYEIVQPTRVDYAGNRLVDQLSHSHGLSRRHRRSAQDYTNSTLKGNDTSSSERIFYKLSAYGINFHLNLTRNDRLVSPSFVVQYWNKGGVVSHHSKVDHCHYEGHLVNSKGKSSVALSNCRGLVSEVLQILFYVKLSSTMVLRCST